ncbi:hypothetical protein EON81_04765 [bacterium]|nr:MAG: hypothetical protein EON81_04765 [bacterium]
MTSRSVWLRILGPFALMMVAEAAYYGYRGRLWETSACLLAILVSKVACSLSGRRFAMLWALVAVPSLVSVCVLGLDRAYTLVMPFGLALAFGHLARKNLLSGDGIESVENERG